MTIEIKVQENESIDSAINRLNKRIRIEYGRRWYKKRLGYFEKPSSLKRKRKRHLKRVRRSAQLQYLYLGKVTGGLQLNIGLKSLFKRTGPNNSMGR